MTCKYAFDAGKHETINRFHKRINELLAEATSLKRQEMKDTNKYWRTIGKQDALLQLLNDVCDMIGEPIK